MTELRVPRVGDLVETVLIVEWLVEAGDRISTGQPLVTVETDKVEVEVEAPHNGTVAEIVAHAETEIAVGAILCRITPEQPET